MVPSVILEKGKMSLTIALTAHMIVKLSEWRNIHAGRLSQSNMAILHKNEKYILLLPVPPTAQRLVIGDIFPLFFVGNGQCPAPIGASLDGYFPDAVRRYCHQVVIRLIRSVLDENIIPGLGENTRGKRFCRHGYLMGGHRSF